MICGTRVSLRFSVGVLLVAGSLAYGMGSKPQAPLPKPPTAPRPSTIANDYSVRSSLPWIKELSVVAECVIHLPEFISEVSLHKQFDYTTDPSPVVASKMQNKTPVIMSSYRKLGSRTIAYRNAKGPETNVIYFNTAKNPRVMSSMVNTAVHERLHVVGYGHGDNYAKGKSNSVPYGVGSIAEKYVERCR